LGIIMRRLLRTHVVNGSTKKKEIKTSSSKTTTNQVKHMLIQTHVKIIIDKMWHRSVYVYSIM
jgi:hypothetical protein